MVQIAKESHAVNPGTVAFTEKSESKMSSKPESQLWYKLRDGTKDLGVFWTRLESWASPGVPDLHGIVNDHPFWLELKVHRLKSLKSITLRPHQIAWQTRYSMNGGSVYNLVHHPSSSTLNIYGGQRAMQIAGNGESWTPDWSCPTPYDWTGIINHILSSKSSHHKEEDL